MGHRGGQEAVHPAPLQPGLVEVSRIDAISHRDGARAPVVPLGGHAGDAQLELLPAARIGGDPLVAQEPAVELDQREAGGAARIQIERGLGIGKQRIAVLLEERLIDDRGDVGAAVGDEGRAHALGEVRVARGPREDLIEDRLGVAERTQARQERLGLVAREVLDEPFSALDAQTREIMQTELLRIWESGRKTVLFITHQIDEAVYLSDRVVVLGRRPGRIRETVAINLPRPRPLSIKRTPAFAAYVDRIWGMIERDVRDSLSEERVLTPE